MHMQSINRDNTLCVRYPRDPHADSSDLPCSYSIGKGPEKLMQNRTVERASDNWRPAGQHYYGLCLTKVGDTIRYMYTMTRVQACLDNVFLNVLLSASYVTETIIHDARIRLRAPCPSFLAGGTALLHIPRVEEQYEREGFQATYNDENIRLCDCHCSWWETNAMVKQQKTCNVNFDWQAHPSTKISKM